MAEKHIDGFRDDDWLLTAKEVSERIGITEGTLAVWRCKKRYRLPYLKMGGKVMYWHSDVEQFIEDRTVHIIPKAPQD